MKTAAVFFVLTFTLAITHISGRSRFDNNRNNEGEHHEISNELPSDFNKLRDVLEDLNKVSGPVEEYTEEELNLLKQLLEEYGVDFNPDEASIDRHNQETKDQYEVDLNKDDHQVRKDSWDDFEPVQRRSSNRRF